MALWGEIGVSVVMGPTPCKHGANLARGFAAGWFGNFGVGLILGRMALSARNQFKGKVVSIKNGAVMSEVVIDIGGGHEIVSLVSASSVKRLRLKKGSAATAVIKATEVIISTDEGE